MLTPAEEQGLSGLSLDSRVRKVFYSLPPQEIVELIARARDEAEKRNLIYVREGQAEVIRVLLRPLAMMPEQLAYVHVVSLTILNALKRLPDLYLEDPSIREVVPLSEPEDAWLRSTWQEAHRESNPVIGRLDAMVDFTSPMWKDSLRFVEPNLCGIGGIFMGPTCEQLLADVVLPVLREHDPQLDMSPGQDLRELFIQEVLDHLETLGGERRNICLMEPKYSDSGPVEQAQLVKYYRQRHGLTMLHAHPFELRLKDGEVWYEDTPVDVAYRDFEIRDLIDLETQQGGPLAAVRELFRQNRMISSLAGDFDHKSCWEILTDGRFTRKYFNADERQIFRRHVLWTRVLRERRTTLPDGGNADLLNFVRKGRESLVIKPNRAYGGEGVLIGHIAEQSEWEQAIDRAMTGPEQWVVQRLATIPVNEFPVVDENGVVHIEPFYTVMGFAPTRYGIGVLGRASQKQVVNVAQRGGMCGVLVGRPTGRLIGPGEPARIG